MSLPASEAKRPIVFLTDDMLVYVMYCIGYFTMFTAFFGVAVAYVSLRAIQCG